MSKGLDWRRAAPKRPTEDNFPELEGRRKERGLRGCLASSQSGPVRTLSKAEIDAMVADRPDLAPRRRWRA